MEITTTEDWKSALGAVDWFHDAITRSLVFVNDERVRSDGVMVMAGGEATLRTVVQTQNRERPAAELKFVGVASFSFDRQQGAEPGEVVPVKEPTTGEMLLRFTFLECEVVARSAVLTPLDWPTSEASLPAV